MKTLTLGLAVFLFPACGSASVVAEVAVTGKGAPVAVPAAAVQFGGLGAPNGLGSRLAPSLNSNLPSLPTAGVSAGGVPLRNQRKSGLPAAGVSAGGVPLRNQRKSGLPAAGVSAGGVPLVLSAPAIRRAAPALGLRPAAGFAPGGMRTPNRDARGRNGVLASVRDAVKGIDAKDPAVENPEGAHARIGRMFTFGRRRGGAVDGRENPWGPRSFGRRFWQHGFFGESEPEPAPQGEVPSPKAETKDWLPKAQRENALRWYHAGRGVHYFGMYLFGVAQPIFLFSLVKKGLLTGISGSGVVTLTLALGAVSYFSLALASGAAIQRWGPKKVSVGLAIAMGVMGLSIPAAYLLGFTPLWFMVALNAATMGLAAVQTVGESTIVPALVGSDTAKLQKTNVLMEVVFGVTAALSALIGGHMVDFFGPLSVMLVFSVLNLAVVLPIFLKRLPNFVVKKEPKGAGAAGLFAWLGDGIKKLFTSKAMLVLFGMLVAYELLVTPFRMSMLPILNDIAFAGGGSLLGEALFSFFLGHTVSNLLARKVAKFDAFMRLLQAAAIGLAAMSLFGVIPVTRWTFVIAPGILAFLTGPGRTSLRTLIQSKVQRDDPGRMPLVMGLYAATASLSTALGIAVIGLLSTHLGTVIPPIFYWLMPLFAGAAALFFVAPRVLRKERAE